MLEIETITSSFSNRLKLLVEWIEVVVVLFISLHIHILTMFSDIGPEGTRFSVDSYSVAPPPHFVWWTAGRRLRRCVFYQETKRHTSLMLNSCKIQQCVAIHIVVVIHKRNLSYNCFIPHVYLLVPLNSVCFICFVALPTTADRHLYSLIIFASAL